MGIFNILNIITKSRKLEIFYFQIKFQFSIFNFCFSIFYLIFKFLILNMKIWEKRIMYNVNKQHRVQRKQKIKKISYAFFFKCFTPRATWRLYVEQHRFCRKCETCHLFWNVKNQSIRSKIIKKCFKIQFSIF